MGKTFYSGGTYFRKKYLTSLLLFLLHLSGAPLFAGSQPEIFFSDPEPHINEDADLFESGWIHFFVVVENGGAESAYNVNIDLYKNIAAEPAPGERGEMTHTILKIDPGQKIKIDFLYQAAEAGNFKAYFFIDPENKIGETDETNNISDPIDLLIEKELTEDNWEVVGQNENDTIDTPKVISKSFARKKLTLKDDDFYHIGANAGEYMRIWLTHDAYIAPIDIYLYNASHEIIASSENRGDFEEISLRLPYKGAYYLEVRKAGANESSYYLEAKTLRMSDLITSLSLVEAPIKLAGDSEGTIEHLNLAGSDIPQDTDKYLVKIKVKATDTTVLDEFSWNEPCNYPGCIYSENSYVAAPNYRIDLFVNRKTPPKVGETGDQPPYYIQYEDYVTSEQKTSGSGNDKKSYKHYTRVNYAEHTFHVIVGPGDYTFSAIADTDNAIPEISETNNAGNLLYVRTADYNPTDQFEDEDDTFHGPNLTQGEYRNLSCWDALEYFHVEVPPGKRLLVTLDYVKTGNDLILYHIEQDEDEKEYILGSSDTGFSRESISIYNNTSEVQTHYFNVGAKPIQYDYLTWSYYSTTFYDLNIALTNELDHDAAINTMSYTPLLPSYGETVTVHTQVENRGTYPLENIRLDLFMLLSPNDTVSQDDISVANKTISSLQPGEKKLIDLNVPVSNMNYNLVALLDRSNTIAETDRANNTFGPLYLSIDKTEELIEVDDQGNPLNEPYNEDAFELIDPPYVDPQGIEYGSNDIWQTAVPIGEGSYKNLVLADNDWYTFNIDPYKWFSAQAIFTSIEGGDIDLLVGRTIEVPQYDDEGNPEIDDATGEQVTITRFVVLRYGGNLGDHELVQFYNDSSSPQELYLAVLPINEAFFSYTLEVGALDGNANGLADLVIKSYSTVPDPATATIYGDDTITTIVAVQNIGSWVTTHSTTVELYYSSAPRIGDYGDLYQIVPVGLLPGETRYYTFEYSLPGGSYPLHFAVDPGNRISESNEENNEASAPYNLVIEGGQSGNISLTLSGTNLYTSDRYISTSVNISNSTYNTDFYLKFRLLGGDDEGGPAERVVYEWDPVWYQGKYNSGSKAYSLGFDRHLVSGNVKLEVIADWGNRVGEDNENDNSVKSAPKLHDTTSTNFSVFTFGEDTAPLDTVMEVYRYTENGYAFPNGEVDPSKLELVRVIDDRNGVFAADTLGLYGGAYFFRVYGYGSAMGDYYIAYDEGYSSWTPDPELAIDESENDDTPGTATRLYANQPQRKTISGWHDEDWYRFQMDSLWLEFAPALESAILNGLQVKLYRDDRDPAAPPADPPADPADPMQEIIVEELTEIAMIRRGSSFYYRGQFPPGRYYISVTGSPLAGDYAVVYNRATMAPLPGVALHDPEVIYEADASEENNDPTAATPITPGAAQNANLIQTVEDTSDTDWYYFEAGL